MIPKFDRNPKAVRFSLLSQNLFP